MYFFDQRAEDDEYEANARYDYIREAYAATAEGLDDGDFEYFDPAEEVRFLRSPVPACFAGCTWDVASRGAVALPTTFDDIPF